jgi:hypothetical protein
MSLPGLTRQSICFEKALAKSMDARVKPGHDECFCVAWFKAQFRDLAARFARGLPRASRLLKFRGRRECRARDAPAASCVKKQTHELVTTVTPERPGIPRAMVYGLLRALPGDQACLTPSPARLLADLTPALGRQNDTTSPSASARFVKRAARVHRIPPHVRNVRTPL